MEKPEPTPIENVVNAAEDVIDHKLNQGQARELISIHESYLANRDSREPYISDDRFLSRTDKLEFYRKLSGRARKLLETLEDKKKDLRKAPVYRKFLIEILFHNAIREVKAVLSQSEMEIKMMEIMKDPQKLATWLESGRVLFIPPADGLPRKVLNRIRAQKIRGRGRTPDLLLNTYVLTMGKWYQKVTREKPGKGEGPFLRLLNECMEVIEGYPKFTPDRLKDVLKNFVGAKLD